MQRPPSNPFRALGSFALVVLFYAASFGLAGLALWIPYAQWKSLEPPGLAVIPLALVGVALAVLVLASTLPHRDRTVVEGLLLDADRQPDLFRAVRAAADAAGAPMPEEIHLVADAKLAVERVRSLLGFGGRSVLVVGTGSLALLTLREAHAAFVQQLVPGGWVCSARAGFERAVVEIVGRGSFLRQPFALLGRLFLRLTTAVARGQTLRADATAARKAGAAPLVDALCKLHAAKLAHPPYWSGEVLPLIELGFLPPLAEGFARFTSSRSVAHEMKAKVKQAIERPSHDGSAAEPALGERVRALEAAPTTASPSEEARALALLRDLPEIERRLAARVLDPDRARSLEALDWDDAALKAYLPVWEADVARNRDALSGITPEKIPDWIGRFIVAGKGSSGEEQGRAGDHTLAAALTVALVRRGFNLVAVPGHAVLLEKGGLTLAPFMAVRGLASGQLTAGDWRDVCAQAGASGIDLGGAE